jgi:predicted nuclease of predicted toxin-antitoxin system
MSLQQREDDHEQAADPVLLDRATALNRVLVTQDVDFLIEGARRQREGIYFAGSVYTRQLGPSIGQVIYDLQIIAVAGMPEDCANTIYHLPL